MSICPHNYFKSTGPHRKTLTPIGSPHPEMSGRWGGWCLVPACAEAFLAKVLHAQYKREFTILTSIGFGTYKLQQL